MENKLASICNILVSNGENLDNIDSNAIKPANSQLKQWRLMVYLDDIKHLNDSNFGNRSYNSNYYIKYQISPKII